MTNRDLAFSKIEEAIKWMLKPDHLHDDDAYLQRACYMHRAYEMKEALEILKSYEPKLI